MNANLLLDKIIEKNLNINEVLEICEKLCAPDNITIGDAIRIKGVLELSDSEAIDIFLT